MRHIKSTLQGFLARTRLPAGSEHSTMHTDDDPECGDHRQVFSTENGTWFVTPGRLSDTATRDGIDFGTVRMPAEHALGQRAAPNRFIAGCIGVRKAVAQRDAARQITPAAQRIASAPGRKAQATTRIEAIRQRLERFTADVLAPTRERLAIATTAAADSKKAFDNARRDYLALPRMHRGYTETIKPVIFVAGGVVAFDAFVLHGVLETSGLSSATVWGTSLTVPVAIAGANEAFGVLAGAIGARVPARHRLKLAAALLAAGLGSLIIAFATLMIFRAEAVTAMNKALVAVATGHGTSQLSFFISPLWMGPLQIAGSFAAITMTALWTMAKDGREYRKLVLAPLEQALNDAERARQTTEVGVNAAEQRVEQARNELEQAILLEHEIEAESQAATAEIDATKSIVAADLDVEDRLCDAMQARYEATYQHHDRLFHNGGVWRAAMATVFPRFGRPYTPGPTDAPTTAQPTTARHADTEASSGSKDQQPQTSPNGNPNHHIQPDRLEAL